MFVFVTLLFGSFDPKTFKALLSFLNFGHKWQCLLALVQYIEKLIPNQKVPHPMCGWSSWGYNYIMVFIIFDRAYK